MLIKTYDKRGIYLDTCMYNNVLLEKLLFPERIGKLNIRTAAITIRPNILLREPLQYAITSDIWTINGAVKLCL